MGSLDTVDSREEAPRLDDFNPVHVDVPTDAVLLVEVMELGFNLIILLPETLKVLWDIKPFPNGTAVHLGPFLLKLMKECLWHIREEAPIPIRGHQIISEVKLTE